MTEPRAADAPTDGPLAGGHWRRCLLPRRLRATEDAAAAFFVRTYARDLTFAGLVSEKQARPVVREYAVRVGSDETVADAVLAEVVEARRAETAAGRGDHAGFDAAVERLRARGVAVRIGLDCCRDVALERVEGEHADGDRYYAVAALDDLGKIARAQRIDVSFSYLDRAFADVLTPELHARAAGGDRDAQLAWLRTVEEAETSAGGLVAAAMREVGGLEVEWAGTPRDAVHVAVPDWRRPLPR